MGRTVFAVENFFNPRIFPSHTFAASSTASGWDVDFIGTGRRQSSLNRWEASDYNTDAYVQVTCDRVRAFDFLALDRGHNLDGYPIQVRVSSDSFATYETISGTVLDGLGETDLRVQSPLARGGEFFGDAYLGEDEVAAVRAAVAGEPRVDGVMPLISETLPVLDQRTQLTEARAEVRGFDPVGASAFGETVYSEVSIGIS